MTKQKIEVEKFKELIKDMYKGFPNWRYPSNNPNNTGVEEVITTTEVREKLEESKFLIKGSSMVSGGKEFKWMLGPSALPLVSSWKTEELTKSIKKLTWIVLIMTGISLFLFIIQTLKLFGVI